MRLRIPILPNFNPYKPGYSELEEPDLHHSTTIQENLYKPKLHFVRRPVTTMLTYTILGEARVYIL